MRLRARLVTVGLAAVAASAAVATQASAAPSCRLAGSWAQTTPGVGSSTWVITADGKAQEHGLGNARGTATLGSNALTINWAISDNFQGVYRWSLGADCSGSGTLTYTKVAPGDPRAGQSYPSTVQGPAPTSGDEAVLRLQRDLKRLGLYSGALDGNAGPQLAAAIKSFQRKAGLAADGDCDQRCRSALNKALGLDDPKRPPGAVPKAPRTVTELQRDLKRLGFYSGPLDGRYDDAVKAAVKRFQRAHGLPVDGRCTARCQFAIVKALTKRA